MPRLGTNAGVIGVEKVATVSQAGGIWTTEEQVIQKRNQNWPVVGGIDINAILYRTTPGFGETNPIPNWTQYPLFE